MRVSIRRRLLIGLLSLVVTTSAFTLVENYYDTQSEIQSLFDAQLAQSARVLLELSAHELYEQLAYLSQKGEDVSQHLPTQIHKYQQEIDFQIWIQGNHLAVRSENAPSTPFIDQEEIFADRVFNNQKWRVYSTTNSEKTMRVQVGQNIEERDKLGQSISTRLLASFAIMLPILALLILFIVGRSFEPLRVIADQIENRKIDNLQPISSHNVPVEVMPMTKALNSLFYRLQLAFENIRVFTANAAHELRTPLAAQKINAQVALQAKDEKARNEALREVVASVNKATNLVEQLLTLSRLDPEKEVEKQQHADLDQVTRDTIAELTPLALRKNIEISLVADNIPTINGKSSILTILVKNIVENAIRYTPDGGLIEVTLCEKQNRILLSISDSGPGIPVDEQSQVFQRFYRAKNHVQEGSGLGLAMVQRIAELHHARILLGKSKLGGLRLDIFFNPFNNASI